ncbi:hypothetical protein BDF14DRAFT_1882965 [Spinellus fusiger]|nr:hypothetical protein BDF14DRAFT_1882965 [Spinellus fusiger]
MSYYQNEGHNNAYYHNSPTPPYTSNQDYPMQNIPSASYPANAQNSHYSSYANQEGYYHNSKPDYNNYGYGQQPPHTPEGYANQGYTKEGNYLPIQDPFREDLARQASFVSQKPRRSCCDLLCCGCCVCCPRWFRWIACIILLIIIGLGIAVGVLAALFKTPTVNFQGVQGQPQFNLQGTTANISAVLSIQVNNPNIESVTFSKIVATAFYPNYHTIPLGGGQKNDVHISSNAITTILFPFSLDIDLSQPAQQSIMTDLLGKCGFLGGDKQQISVDYVVQPTVSIVGIPITFSISNSASFPCPIQASDLANLGSLGSIASLVPPGVLPS